MIIPVRVLKLVHLFNVHSPVTLEPLFHGVQVHWLDNDLVVGGKPAAVDRHLEGPRCLMLLQLGQQLPSNRRQRSVQGHMITTAGWNETGNREDKKERKTDKGVRTD